jgi:hypothetical protein
MKKLFPVMLNVRLTTKQMDGLRRVAETDEVSMSDVVRELIKSRLEESE